MHWTNSTCLEMGVKYRQSIHVRHSRRWDKAGWDKVIRRNNICCLIDQIFSHLGNGFSSVRAFAFHTEDFGSITRCSWEGLWDIRSRVIDQFSSIHADQVRWTNDMREAASYVQIGIVKLHFQCFSKCHCMQIRKYIVHRKSKKSLLCYILADKQVFYFLCPKS